MNTVLISLVVLVAVSSTAYGIVCTPDLCSTVKCAAVNSDNCAGKIVIKGGFCGCCDSCVNVIKEGESCLLLHLVGVPKTADCDDDLYCNPTTNKCESIIV